MASIIKVDQIQSDTGTTQISSSNVVSNKTVTGTTDGTIRNIYRGTQGGLYARSVTSNVSAGATESNAAAHIGKADTTGDISVFIGADQGTGSVVSAPCGYIGAISAGLYYPPLVLQPSGSGSVVIQSGQLKFPASQNASSDPNTLDDYEEGTWTPNVGGNATYTHQNGRYTKIGRLVILDYEFGINVIGTGSTTEISGVPFAFGGVVQANGVVSYFTGLATSVLAIASYGFSGSAFRFYGRTTAGTASSGPLGIFGNGAYIQGNLIYITTT